MNDSNSTTSFAASAALVLDEIKRIAELHRSPHTKRLEFAIHVCLVAHTVRTGYLVDVLFPPSPTEALTTLLTALRKKSAVFKGIMLWHHGPTAQSFVVHVPLLHLKIATLLSGGATECVFVKLEKCPSVSRDPPSALREAFDGLRVTMEESPDALVLPLSELFTQEILIPLAAVVIDYPVAYFPASPSQTSFLEREPLDIYTVSFKWASECTIGLGNEYTMLKFSCPQVLSSNCTELLPGTVISKLRVRFAGILERIGAPILVTHRTETLERVAL